MEIKKGKYRHYKGNEYEVLFIGRHSETLEEMVVYRSSDGEHVWIRPAAMWGDVLDINGAKVLRFTPID